MFILVNPKVSNPPTFSTPKNKSKEGPKSIFNMHSLVRTLCSSRIPRTGSVLQAQVYALPRYKFFGRHATYANLPQHLRGNSITGSATPCLGSQAWARSWAVYEFMTCKSLFYERHTPDLVCFSQVPSSIPHHTIPNQTKPFHSILSPANASPGRIVKV